MNMVIIGGWDGALLSLYKYGYRMLLHKTVGDHSCWMMETRCCRVACMNSSFFLLSRSMAIVTPIGLALALVRLGFVMIQVTHRTRFLDLGLDQILTPLQNVLGRQVRGGLYQILIAQNQRQVRRYLYR